MDHEICPVAASTRHRAQSQPRKIYRSRVAERERERERRGERERYVAYVGSDPPMTPMCRADMEINLNYELRKSRMPAAARAAA